ncbi:hypothetical protein [Deinococcus sp. QL22]|uniref:hypothetical protein n=1 Tax=Deinococcus sp. QL22 TaxID=2939437 RepID=UPI00201791EE|nr:hypothetical protein [Deinococcus sp. QL22]UQN10356.1 hypothetical protein M1R55_29840 [Deinococcus sp. QL22]UQN10490.1 hypothetical protein M1R55_29165 [Deinococcus sp. QL22]
MQIIIGTRDGRPWLVPYPAGHKDGTLEFNRTLAQTRGSGRAFQTGAGTSKALTMEIEIPLSKPINPVQAPWDTGGLNSALITRRKEFWEGVLERAERWYCGARFRQVLGVASFDRSEFAVLRATLNLRDPLWYLSPDDRRPRRYPFENDLGLYPLGMLRVVGEGDSYYDVEYLGGIVGTSVVTTLPYTGLTFYPLELTYDESI